MYKITRKYQDVLKNLYILHVLQILYCVFTIHQIDNYDKLCIKYVYYIFTIHPFFYKNSCAFISSIYDIHIIIFSFPSTISCNISFFKSQCKVVFFFCFPFQDLYIFYFCRMIERVTSGGKKKDMIDVQFTQDPTQNKDGGCRGRERERMI